MIGEVSSWYCFVEPRRFGLNSEKIEPPHGACGSHNWVIQVQLNSYLYLYLRMPLPVRTISIVGDYIAMIGITIKSCGGRASCLRSML